MSAIPRSSPLAGKTVLVTGGARRIGRTFAITCAQLGANVIIHHSSSHKNAEEVAEKIRGMDKKAWIEQCDFSKPETIQDMFDRISTYTTPEVLINNASVFDPLTIENTTLEDWNRTMNINITSPFFLCQAFAKYTSEGRIINILDWMVTRPSDHHLPYMISKSSLQALTKSLAIALAPGILVNGLALGAILQPADNIEKDMTPILNEALVKRFCKQEELQEAIEFLLTGPKFITGDVMMLDGGRHLV